MFVLPINLDNRKTKTPRILFTLMALNCLVWVLGVFALGQLQLVQAYGFYPAHPTALSLLTAMFTHAVLHLAGNMWFLWMFGRQVEDALGSVRFLAAYLVCGVAAQGAHVLFNPHSLIPCVGASGAISGIVGIFFLVFPKSRFDLEIYVGWWRVKTISTFTKAAVGTWIGEQALLGIISQAAGAHGIAFWAHVGGFAMGLVLGALFLNLVPAEKRTSISRKKRLSEGELDGLKEQKSALTQLNLS